MNDFEGAARQSPKSGGFTSPLTAIQGHTEAICELGTLYRFGRGIEQNFVKAAELHVIAALAGDATAFGNLSDYYPEVEKAALAGSVSASLSLAKMYDNSLAVEKDKGKVLAWLWWGKDHGTYDADNARDELDDMLGFYSLTISGSDKAAADALLDRMEKEHPGLPTTKRAGNHGTARKRLCADGRVASSRKRRIPTEWKAGVTAIV